MPKSPMQMFHEPAAAAVPPSACQVELWRHPDEFPEDVRALMDAAERHSIELGCAWFRNFVATMPEFRAGAHFYVLRRDGRARAVLPLVVHDGAGAERVGALSNYYTALYAPACAADLAPAELVPLLDAVRRRHAPVARLRFAPMDPQSPAYATLSAALRQAGWLSYGFFCFGNWYLQVPQSWQAYLMQRTAGLRSTIKRMEKRLQAAGGTVEIIRGHEDLPRAIAAYEQVYAASWKQPEPYVAFVPGLISTCAQQGWLRLGLVWLDGRAVAAQLWIVAHGRAAIYKVAYDERHKDLSLGSVLGARLMQHVLEVDRVQEVDYLIGDDNYKKNWMSHRRERWGLIAYNPRTLRGALGAAREGAGRALKPWLARLGLRRAQAPAD